MQEKIVNLINCAAGFFDGNIVKIITGTAAILSFFFSVVNFWSAQRSKKRNLLVRFEKFTKRDFLIELESGEKFDLIYLRYRISNRSQLPISITDAQLIIDDIYCNSGIHEYKVQEFTSLKTREKYGTVLSTVLPIQLGNLGAASGYFSFLVPPNLLSGNEKILTIELCTTRGKPIKQEFRLYEDVELR